MPDEPGFADDELLDEHTALDDVDLDDLPAEADPADVVDQRREVPLDDERDVMGDGDALVDEGGFEP